MFARVFVPLVLVAGALAQLSGISTCITDCSTQAVAGTDCGSLCVVPVFGASCSSYGSATART